MALENGTNLPEEVTDETIHSINLPLNNTFSAELFKFVVSTEMNNDKQM